MSPARRIHARRTALAIACGCLAALAVAVVTADPARDPFPQTLPRASHPSGPVLFRDDFADTTLSAWTRDRTGVWSVRHGLLRAELPNGRQQHSFLYAGSEEWTDYAVDLDMCMIRGVDKGVAVRVQGDDGIGIDLRGPGYQDVIIQHREWPMGKARATNANTAWQHLRVEVSGNRYRVFVNGDLALEATDKKHRRTNGRIALSAYTGGGGECLVYYDHVVVTALTAPVGAMTGGTVSASGH
jgi:Domain of Unknown Function (DUF1080)